MLRLCTGFLSLYENELHHTIEIYLPLNAYFNDLCQNISSDMWLCIIKNGFRRPIFHKRRRTSFPSVMGGIVPSVFNFPSVKCNLRTSAVNWTLDPGFILPVFQELVLPLLAFLPYSEALTAPKKNWTVSHTCKRITTEQTGRSGPDYNRPVSQYMCSGRSAMIATILLLL